MTPILRTTPHWTDSVNINRSFMEELYALYSNTEFTNQDAYVTYAPHVEAGKAAALAMRYRDGDPWADPAWWQMNVRNILSAAEHRGLLQRVRPGVYRFAMPLEEFAAQRYFETWQRIR